MMSKPRLPLSDLLGRISGKAASAWDVGDRGFRMIRDGRAIIHLGVGDPDLDIAPNVRAAVTDALVAGRTHYAPLAGEPALRSAIAAHATGLYGIDVTPDEVAVCSGAQGALFSVFQLIAGPGDEVIVLEPYYATYPACVRAGGASMVTVALEVSAGFRPNLAAIRAAITPRTRAILVNSPSNPAGSVFAQSDMDALAKIACEAGLWLVSDEVYWSLCYDIAHVSPLGRRTTRDRIIVVNSVSKSHAMTGFRVGWVIGQPDLIEALATLGQSLHFGINQFSQDAACVALADPAIPAAIRKCFRERRDALVAGLSAIDGLSFTPPEGGMFLLVDVSATGMDGEGFANGLLDAEGVAVVPGFGFGEVCDRMVRIGFLADPGRLAEASMRIRRYMAGLIA